MKKKSLSYMVLLAGFLFLVLWDCRKKAEEEATYPNVSFDEISQITSFSAIARGNVLFDGRATVTDKGFCWGMKQNPTIYNDKISIGTGTGSFVCPISGLSSGTTYYIGAYATNVKGTAYSNQVSFTTVAFATVLTTIDLASITSTTAAPGGTITSLDGSTITSRGICWNTAGNPTIADSKTSEGSGTGTFTSNLTGLTPGKTYYVKAYATNTNGTIYGNTVTLKTNGVVPTLTTSAVTKITPTTAACGGDIVTNGGSAILAHGICWSTSPNPTIADNKTIETVKDYIYGSLTGLLPTMTYYVRAYATNSAGTAYGNQVTFTTPVHVPVLTTTAVSDITLTSATSGGNIIDDGGSAIVARGVCWATSKDPTITNSKTIDGTGTGTFTSNITGLTENTVYYLRAYATNRDTTCYGYNWQFRTLSTNYTVIFNPNLTYGTVSDIDGNVYKTIKIGTQTWMAENLKTTRYRNGDLVPGISLYESQTRLCAMYTGYAATDSRNLAPTGWHVPSNAEWTILATFLGSGSGLSMREAGTTHWMLDIGSTNSSGFTALPDKGYDYAGWWTSSRNYNSNPKGTFRCFYDFWINLAGSEDSLNILFSVRCVQD